MSIPWTLNIALSPIDTIVKRVTLNSLVVSTQTSDQFEFVEAIKHYGGTWNEGQAVSLEYPTGTVVFAGRIREKNAEASPVEQVRYVCSGYRELAQNVQVSRGGSNDAAFDSYPERIYNAPTGDPDYPFSRLGPAASVGTILTNLFTSFHDDLINEGLPGGTLYDSTELSVMSWIPPKLVLTSLNFEQAVLQVLAQQGPAWAIWVNPIDAKWHFFDRRAGSTFPITIASDTVVTNRLKRSLVNRFTAVKVVGARGRGSEIIPMTLGFGHDESGKALAGITKDWDGSKEGTWNRATGSGKEFRGLVASTSGADTIVPAGGSWTAGTFTNGYAIFPRYSWTQKFTILTDNGTQIQLSTAFPAGVGTNSPVVLQSVTGVYSDVFRLFQITDPTLRNIVTDTTGEVNCCPHILAILKNSTGVIIGTEIINVRLEGNGVFRTETPMITSPSNGFTTGDSTLFPDFKFIFCYQDTGPTKLVTRYPSSSFSGEASGAPWNVSRELTISSTDFQDQSTLGLFSSLAQEVWKMTSSVGTVGTIVVTDKTWAYVDPRLRVNIAHANSESTGWESLGAGIANIHYDFNSHTISFDLADDGSSAQVDWQAILKRLMAASNLAKATAETTKIGEFVNCKNEQVGSAKGNSGLGGGSGTSDALTSRRSATPSYSNYNFPVGGGAGPDRNCRCDKLSNPCGSNGTGFAGFQCTPDGESGLIVRHPGDLGTFFCKKSHLVNGASGMYYPYVCQGLSIGSLPNDQQNGLCTLGMRALIAIEPADLDDGGSGTQIGVADFVIQLLKSYSAYMQHNEEAHCCLDNRIACVDDGIWRTPGSTGPGCENATHCQTSVLEAVFELKQNVTALRICINSIHYQPGERTPNCNGSAMSWKFDGCGPC